MTKGFFSRERRRKERRKRMATVIFTVQSGKEPSRVSSPVTGTVRDLSPLGMSVLTPKIAPDGIHVMYDTLMTTRNRIDATVFVEGDPPVRVSGKVVWFRGSEEPGGAYIFGMQFDKSNEEFEDGLSLR
ncbi:MAG: PilZ domain-containing protein [Deltaproteobacteria bacterium]|nr:PilZ domain-containing protein [Deltaproteobacteria bacterium]